MSAATPWVKQLLIGEMDNFIYLLGAEGGGECAVVDCAWDVDAIAREAEGAGRKITAALVTHGHHDHINGLPELLRRFDVPVFAQRAEIDFTDDLRALGKSVKPVAADERIQVAGLELQCLHTPGHTPGAQCFLCGAALFTGDTLFIGACGRCDFEGSDVNEMFDSLMRLRALPGETVVYSGHDYGDTPTATIAEEAKTNPYLVHTDRREFVAHRMR